jgi:hypothetical protein
VGTQSESNADLEEGSMSGRILKRCLSVGVVPALAFVTVMFGFAGPASAHHVAGIEANCDHVTVNFTDFPEPGVTVHIAATVEGHAALTSDVLVHGAMSSSINISSATSALAGATADVDVDVTWTFEGPQHVHDTLSVTCGTATTTTTHPATTTTTMPATTTTTAAPGTTTTSTTVAGGGATTTSTTVSLGVSGNETTTTAVAVLGASVSAGGAITPTAASGSSGSLPFTGADTLPLLGAGLASIGAGGAAIFRTRTRRGLTS